MVSRRTFVKASAAAGAMLLAPRWADAAPRTSALAGSDVFLVESDLHNHTLLSDGARAAEDAFAQMRAGGLDVAALTDHATTQKAAGPAGVLHCPSTCGAVGGITEADWQHLAGLADKADTPGQFTALRGFEWTTLSMGHINVWFSDTWTDGASMRGFGTTREVEDAAYAVQDATPLPVGDLVAQLRPVLDRAPTPATTAMFYEWLTTSKDRPVLGGGSEALAGFNHPNLFGNFEDFRYDPAVADRIVSLEMFSFGKDDYLFSGRQEGRISPLTQCLDAGWRVGLIGTSDEHGSSFKPNKGRGGLWVRELTRAGVREALAARRFFAAAEPGMRLYGTANGVRMGLPVPFRSGTLDIELDLHIAGAEGRPLLVQVLATGDPLPRVLDTVQTEIAPTGPIRIRLDHDVDDGRWIVLRVTDPSQPAHPLASGPYVPAGRGLAYSSPFFLDPTAA